MAGTKTAPCTCDNIFQDKEHGKSRRIMNNAPKKGAETDRYRCTSCGKEWKIK